MSLAAHLGNQEKLIQFTRKKQNKDSGSFGETWFQLFISCYVAAKTWARENL